MKVPKTIGKGAELPTNTLVFLGIVAILNINIKSWLVITTAKLFTFAVA